MKKISMYEYCLNEVKELSMSAEDVLNSANDGFFKEDWLTVRKLACDVIKLDDDYIVNALDLILSLYEDKVCSSKKYSRFAYDSIFYMDFEDMTELANRVILDNFPFTQGVYIKSRKAPYVEKDVTNMKHLRFFLSEILFSIILPTISQAYRDAMYDIYEQMQKVV